MNSAQTDILKTAKQSRQALKIEPSFAILFPCLGRGPSFYEGSDQDLVAVKTCFPNLPIICFYGNDEIASIADAS